MKPPLTYHTQLVFFPQQGENLTPKEIHLGEFLTNPGHFANHKFSFAVNKDGILYSFDEVLKYALKSNEELVEAVFSRGSLSPYPNVYFSSLPIEELRKEITFQLPVQTYDYFDALKVRNIKETFIENSAEDFLKSFSHLPHLQQLSMKAFPVEVRQEVYNTKYHYKLGCPSTFKFKHGEKSFQSFSKYKLNKAAHKLLLPDKFSTSYLGPAYFVSFGDLNLYIVVAKKSDYLKFLKWHISKFKFWNYSKIKKQLPAGDYVLISTSFCERFDDCKDGSPPLPHQRNMTLDLFLSTTLVIYIKQKLRSSLMLTGIVFSK